MARNNSAVFPGCHPDITDNPDSRRPKQRPKTS